MAVFVLSKHGKPLMPCSEKRARLLLTRGRAVVHLRMPFVIRLKDRLGANHRQPVQLKLDPGSRATGVALVRETASGLAVINLFELVHRGLAIRKTLEQRRGFRRRRRHQLRYRASRFLNRRKPEGWLAPSLFHRVGSTLAWVKRLQRWAPVSALVQERVKFDMQLMQNPDISGVEYQQGTLAWYEVREYLLEKWNRQCAYCPAKNVPLQIEHMRARANGGSDRVANLTLACASCNEKKGKLPIATFLQGKPEVLKKMLAQVTTPLRDAAAVNSTRHALFQALQAQGVPISTGSGGQTTYNRQRLGLPKTHALDAVCVGEVEAVSGWQVPTLQIRCTGRGSYQRTRLDRYGFPRGSLTRHKSIHGFQTGDQVRASVPNGKHAGRHTGRVAVRASGGFNIQTPNGVVQGIAHRHCTLLQRADGYGYSQQIVATAEDARTG